MLLVRVLEKKGVIRLFGAALLLAPIVNTLAKMSMLTEISNRWTWTMFWKIIKMGSTPNQILYVATVVIGLLMLQGKTTVWKFALMLLGGYIALQISDFGHVRTSWVTWLFFITNVVVFLFIADQLVWKVKVSAPTPRPSPPQTSAPAPPFLRQAAPPFLRQAAPPSLRQAAPQPAPQPRPLSPSSSPSPSRLMQKKILFQFAGNGPWAQLMGVSSKGLHVRSLQPPPEEILHREVEISLAQGVKLRTRLAYHKNSDYYFDYTHLNPEEIRSLNHWIRSLSKAA